jgi:hypothetical protein
MMPPTPAVRIRHPILKGIVVSVVAALIYSYAFAFATGGVKSLAVAAYTFFPALMALPLMSWFIVGAGILLGIILPKLAGTVPRPRAVLYGAAMGFVLGAAGGLLLVFLFTTGARRFYACLALTMAAYVAAWVGAFAHYYAPKRI